MKAYQIAGLLPKSQHSIILNIPKDHKVTTNLLRELTKLSGYEFNKAMVQLKKKGLINTAKNPINKRTAVYGLTKKGKEIQRFMLQ